MGGLVCHLGVDRADASGIWVSPGGVLIIIVKDKWRLERSESRVTTGALSYLRYEYRKTLLEAVVSINDAGRQYLCDRTA